MGEPADVLSDLQQWGEGKSLITARYATSLSLGYGSAKPVVMTPVTSDAPDWARLVERPLDPGVEPDDDGQSMRSRVASEAGVVGLGLAVGDVMAQRPGAVVGGLLAYAWYRSRRLD